MLKQIIKSTTVILLFVFNYFACSHKDKISDDFFEEIKIDKIEDNSIVCTDNDEHKNDINNDEHNNTINNNYLMNENLIMECEDCYYYYFEEKIFLNKVINKIFLTFSPDADENQKRALVYSYSSLQLIDDWCNFDSKISFAALQSENGKPIPSETIDFFINDSMITSATYMYDYIGSLYGLSNQFIVLLKDKVTYEQFEKLSEQYHCIIVERDDVLIKRFVLSVPKTSEFNSMQMSCIFYETGLFEYTTPNRFFKAF